LSSQFSNKVRTGGGKNPVGEKVEKNRMFQIESQKRELKKKRIVQRRRKEKFWDSRSKKRGPLSQMRRKLGP